MASKMLMGDIPELMENILKHLNNEIYSLYSCALVNRHWPTPLITLAFKLFLESGAILHKFGLYKSEFLKLEILHSLEQNVQFYSRLQHLSLDIISNFGIENIAKLLRILAKNTTEISALRLVFHSKYASELIHTLLPALIHFIKSQEQLRKFIINCRDGCPTEFYSIISALGSQKDTLQEATLEDCAFSEEFEALNNCKNLETLRILDCDAELLKILLNNNISTLEISHYQIDVPITVQILEKIGILLQRLKIETRIVIREESLLLEALKSFCPNIIYLYITGIGLSTQLLELIGNLQKLQFLSLGYAHQTPNEERKIRAMQFAKILPSTLQYLDIALDLPNNLLLSFIDILLDHCNAPLKKLLISSISLTYKKNTKALIKYCARIRTLNYVGIVYYCSLDYDIRNELEKYVTLVPYEHIVVNC
ncbi:hypothetical protein F8M41_014337 [Gigaspora margarita]|uniref:F-box domain-containing protein n=1 Tax=Gigaspora margarita TaxID=4874 RepID=A0A8H3ZZX9_GIGMA|nr:hypothetical protein F8M41_014337 [Gigaspora margarita]